MLLVSAIIFIVLDFCYLTIIKKYFQNQIQQVQNSPMTINYLGVVLCYLFLIVALNYFIIKPNRSVNDAFLLGIVIYGVYETTNYALFKNWSIFTVIIDTLWGGTLFAVTTYIINNMRKFI
jgi:uncharacterized membrane protein